MKERKRIEMQSGQRAALPTANRMLPLSVHIVREDDGTGGLSTTSVYAALFGLNDALGYNQLPFRFFIDSIDTIDNSYLHLITNTDQHDWELRQDLLRHTDVVHDTINVYSTILFGVSGTSDVPGSDEDGIIMSQDSLDPSFHSPLVHEMGHYFGLQHTFETAFGVECPNGNNCQVAGDLLCDTPADPDTRNHVSTPSCIYDGSVQSPTTCDTTPYSPQVSNYMSYSPDECVSYFTSEQRVRMQLTLANNLHNLYDHVYVHSAATPPRYGSSGHPFATLAEAMSAVSGGYSIYMTGGNYPTDLIRINQRVAIRKANSGGPSVVIGR